MNPLWMDRLGLLGIALMLPMCVYIVGGRFWSIAISLLVAGIVCRGVTRMREKAAERLSALRATLLLIDQNQQKRISTTNQRTQELRAQLEAEIKTANASQ